MNIQLKSTYFLFLLFVFLVGCSVQEPAGDTAISSNTLPQSTIAITRPIASQTPGKTETATPYLTATPALVWTPTATVAPTSTTSPTLGATVLEGCPIISDNTSPFWLNGSILFSIGRMTPDATSSYLLVEQFGMWAISPDNLDAQLVNEEIFNGILSPDGAMLVDIHSLSNNTQEAIFYDLVSGESQRFEFISDLGRFTSFKWLPDGRVAYITNLEQTMGVGERREGFILDPIKQQLEPFIQQLDLPGYDFDPTELYQGSPSGFATIDPTGQLALYTAMRDSDNSHEIRLLDLQTGEVIWQITSTTFGSREPEWSADGEHALFITYEPTEGTPYAWTKLVSLTRNGAEEDLPPQPLPKSWRKHITSWTLSPDARYIFYSVLDSRNARSFIIDTVTWTLGEICDPEATDFVRDERSAVKGYWVENNYFIYRVVVEREGQRTHSLRVLDIANWTTQVVFEAEPGYGVNLFGWTPVEFPQP